VDYVDPVEVAAAVGVPASDPRVARVVAATSQVIDAYYGTVTVAAMLRLPDGADLPVIPAGVNEAALTIALDLWRRPSTPGGYFQVSDYVGRLAQDPTAPVVVLLNSLGRLSWPIA
jgi:hypothetical protein